MAGHRAPRSTLQCLVVTACAIGMLALPAAAQAADSIYWVNAAGGSLSRANLDGTGTPIDLALGGAPLTTPADVVINPATNRIYWTNHGANSIWRANLDGTGNASALNTQGATVNGPLGLAINPATNRIYWSNYLGNKISRANLDGTGNGSDLNLSGVTVDHPAGLAINPASNTLYWANAFGNTLARTKLDGTGGSSVLSTSGVTVTAPIDVAIDPASNKIYWSNSSSISRANLDGTGGGTTLSSTGASVNYPAGLAIDPGSNSVYWANYFGAKVSRANLDGTGSGRDFKGTSTTTMPIGVALLRAPSSITAPTISGTGEVGDTLTCDRGAWAADALGWSLFRAPAAYAYQWKLGGSNIAEATGATLVPSGPGSYTCAVTASNHAGGTERTSAPRVVTGTWSYSVGPASRAFVSRRVGEGPSAAQTFTVANGGTLALDVGAVSLQGPNAADFVITRNSCADPVPPRGGSCAVDVVFDPVSAGEKTATLALPHDGPGSPSTASVTGTAMSALAPPADSTGSSRPAGPTGEPGAPGAPGTSPSGHPAVAALFSTTLTVDARGHAPLILSCLGTKTCSGTLKIRTAKRVRLARGKKKRIVVLATKSYANLAAATTSTVKVRLNATGRKLLEKRGKLPVVITITTTNPGQAQQRSIRATLHARNAPLPPTLFRRLGL